MERRADLELRRIYPEEDENELKLKGIGFYFGDDDQSSRHSIDCQSDLRKIVDAIDKGMKYFNLKVCQF